MRQHRIVRKHGYYVAQYKDWLFWRSYRDANMWDDYVRTFETHAKALAFVKERVKGEEKWNRTTEVVWRDGCPK